jgi:hypothetical protein
MSGLDLVHHHTNRIIVGYIPTISSIQAHSTTVIDKIPIFDG